MQPATQPSTQPLPVIVPPQGQAAGGHAPVQRRREGQSSLLRIGIISAIAAATLLIVTLVLVIVKPFGLFEEPLEVDRPAVSQVEEAFENANLPDPDLSVFSYIDDENLKMNSIEDFKAGEVQYSKSNGSTEAYCEVSAEAEYENQSVLVKQPVTMRMDYDKKNESWKAGSVRNGTASATPEGPANIDAITEDFPNILGSYDAQIAELYIGAEVSATSTLTAKGGTAVFTATKTEGETSRTCTANAEIKWDDTSGWNVEITSVNGDIEAPEQPANAEEEAPAENEQIKPETPTETPSADSNSGDSNSGNGGGAASNPGDGATMGLLCFTGDLVEIPGTISFDNSGAILLKSDARIRVILDGKTYVVDYFELQGNDSFRNGQHIVIIGEISYRGVLAQAPLVINTNYR